MIKPRVYRTEAQIRELLARHAEMHSDMQEVRITQKGKLQSTTGVITEYIPKNDPDHDEELWDQVSLLVDGHGFGGHMFGVSDIAEIEVLPTRKQRGTGMDSRIAYHQMNEMEYAAGLRKKP